MTSRREKEKGKKSGRLAWTQASSRGGEALCFKLPDGVEMFKLEKTGKVELDFLEYKAGAKNLNCDEGMEAMNCIYESHGVQTPDGYRSVICRMKHFGKKCAVCDWLRTSAGSADPDLVRQARAKSRILWLVNDSPDNYKKPTLKVMDTGFFNKGVGFGELMRDAIEAMRDGDTAFAWKGGTTATIKVAEQSFNTTKFKAAVRIDLHRREYAYPAALLDDAPCLDECLVDPGYETVQQLLTGEALADSDEDDDKDDEPKGKRREKEDPEEDDEDLDSDDEEPAPKAKRKAKPDPDEDEDTEEDEPKRKPVARKSRVDKEDEDEPDDDSDDEPAPKAKAKGKRPAMDDDDDDEPEEPSDLEDEDEEPRRKPAAKKGGRR